MPIFFLALFGLGTSVNISAQAPWKVQWEYSLKPMTFSQLKSYFRVSDDNGRITRVTTNYPLRKVKLLGDWLTVRQETRQLIESEVGLNKCEERFLEYVEVSISTSKKLNFVSNCETECAYYETIHNEGEYKGRKSKATRLPDAFCQKLWDRLD